MPSDSRAPVSVRLARRTQIAESGCWLWIGTRDPKTGYGALRIGKKMMKAHRVSWDLYNGPIPDGLKVLHQCDVPNCINPDHLFLGTQLDNVRDMIAKGRKSSHAGELNGRAKLTAEQAAEIKLATGSLHEIARRYGVGKSIVGYIRSGQNWKHL